MQCAAADVKPRPSRFVGWAVGTAVISSFLFGYSICVLNTCIELMAVSLEWCNNEWQADCLASQHNQALVNAVVYLGAAFGALAMGRACVLTLGCRLQIVLADCFFVIGAVACGLAPGLVTVTFGRLVSGVGVGLSAIAAPMYIAEMAPRERRGAYCAMNGVLITLGILASIMFGIPQSPPPRHAGDMLEGLDAWFWRALLGFPACLAMLQALLFVVVAPEDPPSLWVQRGNRERARSVLHQIYGLDSKATFSMDNKEHAVLELQLNDLVDAAKAAKYTPKFKTTEAIRDPFFRHALFIGIGLAALQQLCGINALMSYSNSLFAQGGIAPSSLTLASTLMAVANVACSLLSSRLVDSWGRRKLLIVGVAGQTLAMTLLILSMSMTGTHSSMPASVTGPITVACFCLFVTSFSAGLGAIVWIYLAEIYPQEIRGSALSTCGITNWVCSFTVVYGGRFLSLQTSCYIFGGICAVGLIAVYVWIVETKGCSLEDSPLTPRSDRTSSPLLNSPRSSQCEVADELIDDSDVETVTTATSK